MGTKLRRRSVYLATGVAILAMVAGFAMATGAFLPFGTTTVNGNQGAISTGDTIYSPGISGSLLTVGTPTDCGQTGDSPGVLSAEVATAWVAGGSSGTCGGGLDYALLLNFTSTSTLSTGTFVDSFTISSEFGGATSFTTEVVSIKCIIPTGVSDVGSCQADIYIDSGTPTTAAQPSVGPIDVSVTGA